MVYNKIICIVIPKNVKCGADKLYVFIVYTCFSVMPVSVCVIACIVTDLAVSVILLEFLCNILFSLLYQVCGLHSQH